MENFELAKKLVWGLAASACASCMVRNDYNVLFSFLTMIILVNYYRENPKFFSKIVIHLMAGLLVIDVFWLIIIMPYWNSSLGGKNKYWDSLSGVHSFAIFMAFVEIALKGGVLAIFFLDYKSKHDIAELMKLNYDQEQESLKTGENVASQNFNSNANLNGNLDTNPKKEVVM